MSPLWRYSCRPSSIALPRPRAAQPMWVSRIWPTFIRLGTPSGLSTKSTGRAVGEERHVLLRHHLGDHALVAVAAGHLVAGLQLALHRDEDLDHLHHARRQVVAAADLLDLVLEAAVERLLLQLELAVQRLLRLGVGILAEGELPPLAARQRAEQLLVDDRAGLDALRALHRGLAEDQVLEARVDVALEDRELVVAVAAQAARPSSRSICSARSSLSTPCRLKTRTSTTVP